MRHFIAIFAILFLAAAVCAATVSISPSGGDDSVAMQSACSAAGTVTISGTLKISKTITPANNVSLSGGGLQWTGATTGAYYLIKFAGSGFTDTGTTYSGAGLNLDGASNVSFTRNVVQNCGSQFEIYFGSLHSSAINLNHFTGTSAVGAVMGYNASNTTFNDNTFTGDYECVHILWNNASGGCEACYNDCSGFTRHGIELQGDPQGLNVDQNYVHDPANSASHIWMSIATGGETTRNDCATGVVIKGNVCTAPKGFNANPAINYCAIEAMGIGAQVTGNFIAGMGWGGLYSDNALKGGTTTMSWTGNQYHAVAAGVPCTGEGSASYLASLTPLGVTGNTSDAVWTGVVPAAILASVGPSAMGATSVVTTPPPVIVAPPATQPTLKLADNGDGSITVTAPAAFASVTIAGSAPADTKTLAVSPPSASVRISGVPNSWLIFATVPGMAPATVQAHGGGAVFAPVLVAAVVVTPVTPPTITEHVITTTTVYSNGTSSTVTATQP